MRLGRPRACDERVWLRFGAVDYLAEVWLDGVRLGQHEGGETPFAFDVSEHLAGDGEHLLAVRVLNPTPDPIDGYILDQAPHRNKVMPYSSGNSFNHGGILYPVELEIRPAIDLADLVLRPDPATGAIAVLATVRNPGQAKTVHLQLVVSESAGEGRVLAEHDCDALATSGESSLQATVQVPQHRLWELNDPMLYRVTAVLDAPGQKSHQRSARCGFRDFRLVDGFFHLNGRRIFLKCSHTGNHVPIGQQVAVVPDHVRRDVINAKACGFNALRFIAGVAWPDQLDFCDEIGLLVIESSYAGWLLGVSSAKGGAALPYDPVIEERFDRNTTAMVLRDRNHPSVVAWELLNETEDGRIFRHAAAFLPDLRRLDPARLVFLNSGRFDNDFNLGSCSNPGSTAWEHVWGAEAPGSPPPTPGLKHPSVDGSGDFHFYPSFPQKTEALTLIRNLGQGTRPVFLSEYGFGSLQDVITELRHFEEVGARPDLEDAVYLRHQADRLTADWRRLGLEDVYPFVEDLLRDSQRLSARQRTRGFDLIRANPRICGFNLTGLLDHGMSGEGLWRFWRDWKPGMFDAVCDGWAPLRWCLFADPLHATAGQEITVEAVLANEGVLKPGAYPVRLRLMGPEGPVWERTTSLTIPDRAALAVPVLHERLRLTGPEGRYVLAATLDSGGAPSGGRLDIQVSDPARTVRLSGRAETWGLDAAAGGWLAAHGLDCTPLATDGGSGLILVGRPDAGDEQGWVTVLRRLERGATVVFLDPLLFKDQDAVLRRLPLAAGRCVGSWDFLYHKECIAQRHPVFAGLQGPGVMDADVYGQVIPGIIFIDLPTPDLTLCAAFHTGHCSQPGGYRCSLLLAQYRHGASRFLLNSLDLLGQLGHHPAAGRLLANLIHHTLT